VVFAADVDHAPPLWVKLAPDVIVYARWVMDMMPPLLPLEEWDTYRYEVNAFSHLDYQIPMSSNAGFSLEATPAVLEPDAHDIGHGSLFRGPGSQYRPPDEVWQQCSAFANRATPQFSMVGVFTVQPPEQVLQTGYYCSGGGNYLGFEAFYPQREDALAPEDRYSSSGSSVFYSGELGGNWILFGDMDGCDWISLGKYSGLDGSIGINLYAPSVAGANDLTLAHETFHYVTNLSDQTGSETIGDDAGTTDVVLEGWCPDVLEDPAEIERMNRAWSWLDAPPWVWCLMPSGSLTISTRRRCHAALHGQARATCTIPEDFQSCFTMDTSGLLE
jgi:hypothetical protein